MSATSSRPSPTPASPASRSRWPDARSAADELLGEIDLEHGDRIGCGRQVFEHPPAAAGRFVVAVAGPDSGLHVQLHDGDKLTFGRSGADVTMHDPFMSSVHFAIEASAGRARR